MSEQITQLSIKELLDGRVDYVIPMYQRNYAWDEGEITQLIQDVIDYLPKDLNYYIGTLVVFERLEGKRVVYETIDGQQRLTTLSLLASYLKNNGDCDVSWYEKLAIDFDSREHSRQTFDAIFRGDFKILASQEQEINTAILNGYRLIEKILPQKLNEYSISIEGFANYLFTKVQIMRVKVPQDTDLNHYFEIMNNRGEQLEKHEVLKSRMMEVLQEDKEAQNCLHLVWESCANMEKYVQMGFTPAQRDTIFGEKDWGQFKVSGFDALRDAVKQSAEASPYNDSEQTLDTIISGADALSESEGDKDKKEEPPERFNSVINFPNFLLHVLRVQTEQDIPLDDKRLIDTFKEHVLNGGDVVDKVKQFTFDLLRCKFHYDQYVIKREFIKGTDGWSLKRLKWMDGGAGSRAGRAYYVNTFGDDDENGGDNRRILMLLSAFHVSTPTLVYKHWLNAALHYLFTTTEIQATDYLKHLESVAKAFVFDRFLKPDGSEYFDIIYTNKGACQTLRENVSEEYMKTRLSFGNIENNLAFNFLDYLLWQEHQTVGAIIKEYEFTFRSSVEHYYPQHPLTGHDTLSADILNSFGNLCLISHSKNSRLSNFMPEAKKDYYRNNTIDSIKQYLMMKYDQWTEATISEHYEAMKNVFLNSLATELSEEEAEEGANSHA